MSATLIDGRKLATAIRQELRADVERLKEQGVIPGLAVVIVGDDPASHTYVKYKAKACQEMGLHSEVIQLPKETTESELLHQIMQLNENPAIDGILVQLPLPGHLSEKTVLSAISPYKDVDGFHPHNAGQLQVGAPQFIPCTPHGILKMIEATGVEVAGKHAVVVGRSNIVGKPMGMLLLQEDATVTICHSKTKDLASITRQADILIVACGQPELIGAEHVTAGTVVIDVGTNRLSNGKLVGDVSFEEVKEIASYITPVPGGVGPMTITMLLYNTIQAARQRV